MEAKKAEKSEISFGTYFKKQEFPQFKRDCIDYIEFKRRWNNLVYSFQLPPKHELELLTMNHDERK